MRRRTGTGNVSNARTVYFVACQRPFCLIVGIFLDKKENVKHYYLPRYNERDPIVGSCDIDEIEKQKGFRKYHKKIVEKLRAEINFKIENP
ncbi:MAG: hypothetical protein V1928_02025 [Parcubacteria group bacterium]